MSHSRSAKKEPIGDGDTAERCYGSLERVLGLTSTNSNSICVNPKTGDVVYIAGCFVIIYNPKENKQTHHL
jgi:mitogen-activated protein kinase binding protein 1